MNEVDQVPSAMADHADPDRVLPMLQLISDLVGKRCDRFLGAKYGLTLPQYQLLLAAVRESDATLGGLSEQLNCSRGNVTGIVDRLERDGWLHRERSAEDRRVITVKLTERSEQVEQISKELDEELANLAKVWDQNQRVTLMALLTRIYKELKE
ncbi:MAG: MarR family winged helix-turn-helix transcriptional regulator [Chitinophagales bacterium]